MSDGGASAAAAAAVIANAIKASGTVVRVEPDTFVGLLRRVEKPLVIYHHGGLFIKNHQYLTSYKGFAFFTKSGEQIDLPRSAEVIVANSIWIPS
jgi:hypothetical protein